MTNPTGTTLVWFRQDLRLADNPALYEAAQSGSIVPVFIWYPGEGELPMGAASKWWLHNSLASLADQLDDAGAPLVLVKGKAAEILPSLAKQTGARAIHWNRRYEPALEAEDQKIQNNLQNLGLAVHTHKASLLSEPWEIHNQSGFAFKVFTPFWKHCLRVLKPGTPLPAPKSLQAPSKSPPSLSIEDLELLPKINWHEGMQGTWKPGEIGAQGNIKEFQNLAYQNYSKGRDIPGVRGTSRLSPHLHFGEISPRQIWHSLETSGLQRWKESQFLAEVGWREFGYHLLHAFPETIYQPLRPEFKSFPWEPNESKLRAWQFGQTGYPLVDAGMRELWASGWMHNRIRMLTASFLIKHLLQDWREGAKWFWDTLVDADLASNTLGWQWTAGCGADAAPFFRIFNPTSQAKKFDPDGTYIHKWVPELRGLKAPDLFEPWKVPPLELGMAGIQLGETYPHPIVDHPTARQKALDAYTSIKGK